VCFHGFDGYQGHLLPAGRPRYSFLMAAPAKAKYRCIQCEMTEDRCECEKYCCLCQSQIDIRLCSDGLMYCAPCRQACDYKTE
jgi:hypothetical protein